MNAETNTLYNTLSLLLLLYSFKYRRALILYNIFRIFKISTDDAIKKNIIIITILYIL